MPTNWDETDESYFQRRGGKRTKSRPSKKPCSESQVIFPTIALSLAIITHIRWGRNRTDKAILGEG